MDGIPLGFSCVVVRWVSHRLSPLFGWHLEASPAVCLRSCSGPRDEAHYGLGTHSRVSQALCVPCALPLVVEEAMPVSS